ncbi:unnamed protein product [Brassicogethes aeneus]|nr:unnamed protein product [Brassicogethes aeneus]
MYNNGSGYNDPNYNSSYPPPGYQNYGGGSYGYHQSYNSYPTSQSEPGPPGDGYPNNWGPSTNYQQPTGSNDDSKQDAVAQEMQQQKAQLMTQREEYVKKASVLKRELELLRDQKQDLLSDGSRDRDLDMILRENDKLQDEIQGKLKAIVNVIEMLSSIIKDGKNIAELESQLREDSPKNSRGSPNDSVRESRDGRDSRDRVDINSQSRYCFVHYDTGLHWCRVCDEFPETAKDFLVHLQTPKHLENVKRADAPDATPWHKLPPEPLLPSHEDAPKKRLPIKGLQFFISAPSWYCKLCDVWIGDLHCASHHLKSQAHYQNFENFNVQNPQWEVDWLKDRDKAKSRVGLADSSDDDKKKKKKKLRKEKKIDEKKKKKKSKKRRKDSSDSSSSSSSSDSSSEEDRDKSRSIRVAMRNVKAQSIMDEDLSGKWSVLERLVEEHKMKEKDLREKEKSQHRQPEDKLISQWMTVSEPQKKDVDLLVSLKDRMKVKQDVEKARQAELERKRAEKERMELEEVERKKREAKDRAEEGEREKKRREQEEFNRILDRQRNQVKFKTFRRRRSESDEEGQHNQRERETEESPRRQRTDSNHQKEQESQRGKPEERRRPEEKKKPPPPPSYKKLPFIGRMPLFKNKKPEDKVERHEVVKEDYEPVRRTRFEPGNLPRAFIPRPDVVCFPKLSCIPPLTIPPPPTVTPQEVPEPPKPPSPPKISKKSPPPPPPPKIGDQQQEEYNNGGEMYQQEQMMEMYYDYGEMYGGQYDYSQEAVPLSHTLPLEPPPLPPDDDLAMLGICADDMAAQTF